MNSNDVRDAIAESLENIPGVVSVKVVGNRVHLFTTDREFEIVVRTTTLEKQPENPIYT